MKKVSRRELGQVVAGLAAARVVPRTAHAQASPQAPGRIPYIGPLTGIEQSLADRRFDPVAYTRELYAAAPRRLRFQARTRSQAETWQKTLRAKLTELVGGFPTERPALRPVVLETRSFAGYRREKVVFESRPGVSVLAYVLLPEKAAKPAATMICVPGHGRVLLVAAWDLTDPPVGCIYYPHTHPRASGRATDCRFHSDRAPSGLGRRWRTCARFSRPPGRSATRARAPRRRSG